MREREGLIERSVHTSGTEQDVEPRSGDSSVMHGTPRLEIPVCRPNSLGPQTNSVFTANMRHACDTGWRPCCCLHGLTVLTKGTYEREQKGSSGPLQAWVCLKRSQNKWHPDEKGP